MIGFGLIVSCLISIERAVLKIGDKIDRRLRQAEHDAHLHGQTIEQLNITTKSIDEKARDVSRYLSNR
jgi:hypothetical protein